MRTIKVFLASSSELNTDRDRFEQFVGRLNKELIKRELFIELVMWEDFLDVMSKTRLQDEYNKAIRESDLFVMLFFSKVGKYTQEEFDTAFGQFQATTKPLILTYFKEGQVSTAAANKQDLMSLWAFQERLEALGHFQTRYENVDRLIGHFRQQLDRLLAQGILVQPQSRQPEVHPVVVRAEVGSGGAVAQGTKATAVGHGGVYVGGSNYGPIATSPAAPEAPSPASSSSRSKE